MHSHAHISEQVLRHLERPHQGGRRHARPHAHARHKGRRGTHNPNFCEWRPNRHCAKLPPSAVARHLQRLASHDHVLRKLHAQASHLDRRSVRPSSPGLRLRTRLPPEAALAPQACSPRRTSAPRTIRACEPSRGRVQAWIRGMREPKRGSAECGSRPSRLGPHLVATSGALVALPFLA